MPILVQEIHNRMLSALDAEGSDRYLFDQDTKPGLRYAQEWLVSAFNKIFSTTKLSGENLRELVRIRVWQANNYSRIAFDDSTMGHKLWSILAIYPDPEVTPFTQPSPDPDKAKSKLMPNLTHVSSKNPPASRLTLEQWNDNQSNVFMPGNNTLMGDLVNYAYLDMGDYTSTSYADPGKFETEIRPSVANKFVTVAYLKRPSEVNAITDSLEFPDAMMDIVLEKLLSWISYKQGDGTTLYMVTERDMQRLSALIS